MQTKQIFTKNQFQYQKISFLYQISPSLKTRPTQVQLQSKHNKRLALLMQEMQSRTLIGGYVNRAGERKKSICAANFMRLWSQI
jgi:hypothetical protein